MKVKHSAFDERGWFFVSFLLMLRETIWRSGFWLRSISFSLPRQTTVQSGSDASGASFQAEHSQEEEKEKVKLTKILNTALKECAKHDMFIKINTSFKNNR